MAASQWDMGPATPAQQDRKIIEDATWTDPETGEKRNPNGVKRARRLHICEIYHRDKQMLTARQLKAALEIYEAAMRGQRSRPAVPEVKVDTSAVPSDGAANAVDARRKFRLMQKMLDRRWQAYVMHCAVWDRPISSMPGYRREAYMERLRLGLEDLAEKLRF